MANIPMSLHPMLSSRPDPLSPEEFDALLEAAQPRLKGYVASILGAWSEVDDLVQETNLVLVRKREEFSPGTNFIAWAFRVAYFKATTWRRDRMREGRVVLGEAAFQQLAAHAETRFSYAPPVVNALAECLDLLPARDRSLVNLKYGERRSLTGQAEALGCSANSLHKTLSRIRLVLRKCLRERLLHQP